MQISASEHLRKICRQHADAIDDENLEFMRMFAYTGDSITEDILLRRNAFLC